MGGTFLRIVGALLSIWVALYDRDEQDTTPEVPSVLAFVVIAFWPMLGLLSFSRRAVRGPAHLALTILDPDLALIALAVSLNYHLHHPLLFLLACGRTALSRPIQERIKAALLPLLSSFSASDILRDRTALNAIYSGDTLEVSNASSSVLRSVRTALTQSISAIESKLSSSVPSGLCGRSASSSSLSSATVATDDTCAVCMSEPATVRLVPCLHRLLCDDCFRTLRETTSLCPYCRVPFVASRCDTSRQFAVLSDDYDGENITRAELKRAGLWRQHKRFLASLDNVPF